MTARERSPRHPLQPSRLPPLRRRPGRVEQVCAELGESYVEVSIDDDPELQRRFGEEIPVTFVDGRQHDFWRVDPARLRAALALTPRSTRERGSSGTGCAALRGRSSRPSRNCRWRRRRVGGVKRR